MTGSLPRTAVRALAAVEGIAGLALLARPDDVVRTLAPRSAPPPRWVVRLLGARQLLQAAALGAAPTRTVLLVSAATDGLHAASMVPAGLRWPALRRSAGASGGAAAVFCALELAAARATSGVSRPTRELPGSLTR